MLRLLVALQLLASLHPLFALPFADTYRLKESHPAPKAWSIVRPADANEPLTLQIALKQGNFADLERHLLEVSDPASGRYRQHLSADQVHELVRPTQETHDLVHSWLLENGVAADRIRYSTARDVLTIRLPVSVAEGLLQTKYSVWQHGGSGEELTRTPDWSLPQHLHEHIDSIQPTNYFTSMRAMAASAKIVEMFPSVDPNVGSVCNASRVTLECLRDYYQISNYTPQVPDMNSMGIAGFLGENGNFSDLAIFTQTYAPYATGANFSVETINGAVNLQQINATDLKNGVGAEAQLDLQTATAVIYPTNLTFYDVAGMPPFTPDNFTETNYPGVQTNEPYMQLVDYFGNSSTIPNVLSISYGEDEQTVPKSYADSVCQSFARLGARGMSILVASGDSGVGPTGFCQSNNGSDAEIFLPAWPAGCPYVTTVGATTGFNPEVAANDSQIDFYSGAGFSNYFARPSYQASAVSEYINDTLEDMYAGMYNKSGRGYPDVAANGQRYQVIYNGSTVTLDGTSASTPLFASIITLVNDALIANGKSPLGFLNPAFYANNFTSAFHDITNGSSAGCGTTGYPAAPGWDAVTGLGSPNFLTMLELLGVSNSTSSSNSTSAPVPVSSASASSASASAVMSSGSVSPSIASAAGGRSLASSGSASASGMASGSASSAAPSSA